MNIDLQIYLKSLRDFFDTNEDGKKELLGSFPGVDFEAFMEEVEKLATTNYDKLGDPNISKKQIINILQILHAQVMRDGLQQLIESGEIDIEKDHHGLPQVKLTPQFHKELDQLKVFQKSELGPICLN